MMLDRSYYRPVFLVARGVYRCGLREKAMYGFLFLAALFIMMANVPFSIQDPHVLQGHTPQKSALQIGFMAINIFCLLLSILVSLNILQDFLSRDQLNLLLPKPVKRWQIMAGVILGLFEIMFMNWLFMASAIWLILLSHTGQLFWNVWTGLSVTLLLILVYIALMTFFYTLLPSMVAAVMTVLFVIAGFGASLAKETLAAHFQGLLLKTAVLSVKILPPINELSGLSMDQLGFFDLHVPVAAVLLRTLLLIAVMMVFSCWRFSRSSQF